MSARQMRPEFLEAAARLARLHNDEVDHLRAQDTGGSDPLKDPMLSNWLGGISHATAVLVAIGLGKEDDL